MPFTDFMRLRSESKQAVCEAVDSEKQMLFVVLVDVSCSLERRPGLLQQPSKSLLVRSTALGIAAAQGVEDPETVGNDVRCCNNRKAVFEGRISLDLRSTKHDSNLANALGRLSVELQQKLPPARQLLGGRCGRSVGVGGKLERALQASESSFGLFGLERVLPHTCVAEKGGGSVAARHCAARGILVPSNALEGTEGPGKLGREAGSGVRGRHCVLRFHTFLYY